MQHIPTNYINPEIRTEQKYSFFDSFYRPGLLLVHFIEYYLFGLNAYLFHFFIVLIHVINSLILFYIFRKFLKIWVAFLCTIFFCFNSTLVGWVGKIDTQQHQIDLFLFLILCLCAIRFVIENNNSKFLIILIGLLHLFCLSIRETFIVTPIIISLLIPLIYKKKRTALNDFLKIIGVLIGFTIIYIFMKQIYYSIPMTNFSMPSAGVFVFPSGFVTLLKATVLNFHEKFYFMIITVFINHKFYFFCEHNNILIFYKLIKNLLLIVLGCLFFINQRKIYIFCGFASIALLTWQQIFGTGLLLRHFYELLPTVALILGIFLQFNKYEEFAVYKYIMFAFVILLTLINIFLIIYFQRIESRNWGNFSRSLEKLKKHALPEYFS